ncbi:MAG: hypothetical protein P4L81_02860 [Candidatus Pacebacteria bacterium]|nr:hypothetical protein [Candidatus Paceibacterota bacterium]
MSDKEAELFRSFVRNSDNYIEFGTGGSTIVASQHVTRSITSVDSSVDWLAKVQSACADSIVTPKLVYVDIGPTGDWGYPVDQSAQSRWPRYHEIIWDFEESREADLYMIDGRFRVACFAKTVINCDHNSIIGFHDFASRKHYHCVYEIAREIATAEDMSFFQPLSDVLETATKLIEQYKYNPA